MLYLMAEKGYGAPIKVTTMRLFSSIEEAIQFAIDEVNDRPKKRGKTCQTDITWKYRLYSFEDISDKAKRIKDVTLEEHPLVKALPLRW